MKKESWESNYELLKEYLDTHNGKYPKAREKYKDINLGLWINRQRMIYNNGIREKDGSIRYRNYVLSKEQIEKLNAINFKWRGSSGRLWNDKYKLFIKYLEEHNGKYPTQNEEYKESKLGQWVSIQRLTYNNGKKLENGSIIYGNNILTKEKIEKLNKINFRWGSEFEFNWNKNYELLKEYIKEHNGRYPRVTEVYKGIRLGSWIHNQRNAYNNGVLDENGLLRYNSIILTKEKIDKLNKINFEWTGKPSTANWDEKFRELKEYLEEHDGKYPKKGKNNNSLFNWIIIQRSVYNNGEIRQDGTRKLYNRILRPEQIDKLNSIGFIWKENLQNIYNQKWEEKYELLKEYLKNHNGKFPLSNEVYKDIKLGIWMSNQRKIYNRGIQEENGNLRYDSHVLTKKQIEKLNEINFKWQLDNREIYENRWEEKYNLLKEYLIKYNGKYPEKGEIYKNVDLSTWVNTQRTVHNNGYKLEDGSVKYKSHILTRKQIDMLDNINFAWFSYKKSDYLSIIKNKKMEALMKKKILYKLKRVLSESKNEIESKEEIEKISDEFIKVLTLFD